MGFENSDDDTVIMDQESVPTISTRGDFFPFSCKEHYGLYAWFNSGSKVSEDKMNQLLAMLTSFEFNLNNIPSSFYHFSKIGKFLPAMPIGL
jgi:hypothetical protein